MKVCIPNHEEIDERQEILLDCDAEDAGQELLSLTRGGSSGRSLSMRAVSSVHVLSCFSRAFATHSKPETEVEAARLFGLSQETNVVEQFLSHSWSAGRYMKWAALCYHYHKNYAVCLAHFSWFILSSAGVLLRFQTEVVLPFSLWFSITTFTPFVIALAFTGWGQHFFRGSRSKVFVDRLCIHQWDEELKALGVRSLGEVLMVSKNMVILWSDDYLDRLWCIFEMATFCSYNKGTNGLILLPLWQTPFLYAALLLSILSNLLCSLTAEYGIYPWLVATFGTARGLGVYWCIFNFWPACFICINIRLALLKKTAMEGHVANFELAYTQLSVEDDRDFIYGHIRKLFGTLENFEELVRTDVLKLLHRVIGEAWKLPYSWGIFAFQPYLWYLSADALSMPDEGAQLFGCSGWKEYLVADILFFGIIYVLLPVCLKASGYSSHMTKQWSILPGVVADVAVFELTLFCIVYFATFIYELVFLWQFDTTLVAPLNPFNLVSNPYNKRV
mmetsp:Transcript_12595/g.28520  ORF Transcript_12595/g.28520 Transcript_12595/m.28520 type:complete len:503 (+) Transcript_12595:119-1627(+)